MKEMKDYSIGVETISEETKSVLIGGEYLAQKLALVLHNRGLSCLIVSKPRDLDLTTSPEFVFLFTDSDETLPEIVLNFVESIRAKLIIVLIDKPSGENAAKQCLSKDIDFCFVSIYDLYGGGKSGTALEKIFMKVKNENKISFKNDQIIVTPIFIDDAVEGLCRVAFSTQTFKKNFVLTGKEEIPLVGFVNRVAAEAAGTFGFQLKSEEYSQDYPDMIIHHERILKRDDSYLLLNWQPEVGFSDGIRSALELSKPINNDLRAKVADIAKKQPEVKKKTALSP
jgi:hypothetical protein